MLNRRSLLAIFSAGFAAVITRRARAEPSPLPDVGTGVMFPRGTTVSIAGTGITLISTGEELVPIEGPEGQVALSSRMALPEDPWPAYPRGATLGRWVSTGDVFVLRISPEGRAVLKG